MSLRSDFGNMDTRTRLNLAGRSPRINKKIKKYIPVGECELLLIVGSKLLEDVVGENLMSLEKLNKYNSREIIPL